MKVTANVNVDIDLQEIPDDEFNILLQQIVELSYVAIHENAEIFIKTPELNKRETISNSVNVSELINSEIEYFDDLKKGLENYPDDELLFLKQKYILNSILINIQKSRDMLIYALKT